MRVENLNNCNEMKSTIILTKPYTFRKCRNSHEKEEKRHITHKNQKKIEPSLNVGSLSSIINTLVSQPNTKNILKIRKNN